MEVVGREPAGNWQPRTSCTVGSADGTKQRLGRLHSHLSALGRHRAVATAACAAATPSATPSAGCDVVPTTDAATALRNFEDEGFCILQGVLSREQVAKYRDHLLGVMGDWNFLDDAGRRRDPATTLYTEPAVVPPRANRSYTLTPDDETRYVRVNAGQGQRWHNGDFGGRYNDELRLMVEGYVRHDPRWAAQGCENERVRAVIEPLLGDDFRVVYTDGAVDYPGASALGWHSDGPILSFNGKALDASPRVTSLWMLSDFTAENGCALNSSLTQPCMFRQRAVLTANPATWDCAPVCSCGSCVLLCAPVCASVCSCVLLAVGHTSYRGATSCG